MGAPFSSENAAELLKRYFASVERRDAYGTVTFGEIGAVREYFGSSERLTPALERLPDVLRGAVVARRRPTVFVATKAA